MGDIDLNMEVDNCLDLLVKLGEVNKNFQESVTNLLDRTKYLVENDWQGTSAGVFLHEYTTLDHKMRGFSSGLIDLESQLRNAIQTFKNVDSGFG
jgi:uncharacterized protein YukE